MGDLKIFALVLKIRMIFIKAILLKLINNRVSTIREIGDLYNSGKVMEKSGNFLKVSPNQGTLHFCLLNVAKKLPNRRYQKEEAKGEGNETKFKKKKRLKLS